LVQFLPLYAKKRLSILYESEGILCCFAQKASVRRHESTAIILVLRGSFAWQQGEPVLAHYPY
jgi:hypothetical protein